MERKVYITTIDNPFNPFEDFTSWYNYDCEKGYYTCSKLARIANVDEFLTSEQEIEVIESAIERLIEIDPLDIYRKVVKDTGEGGQ